MFHQARVADEHTDFLRFLRWPEGYINQERVEYRMSVHLFGAVSSPSCACYALRKTAEDSRHRFPAEAINTVTHNFYVDDLLKSLPMEEETVLMVKNLMAICKEEEFQLTKWTSNSREVLHAISEEHRSKNVHELDLDRDKLPLACSGVWRLAIKEQLPTRRGILSVVSSVYDPLGFLAPLTFVAKIMLQELCCMKYYWDDPVPQALQLQWRK